VENNRSQLVDLNLGPAVYETAQGRAALAEHSGITAKPNTEPRGDTPRGNRESATENATVDPWALLGALVDAISARRLYSTSPREGTESDWDVYLRTTHDYQEAVRAAREGLEVRRGQ